MWCPVVQLEDVYAQVYKSLKPGALFASYEWVATKLYDPDNADHVRIIDEINFGNGLPVPPPPPPILVPVYVVLDCAA